MHNIIKSGLWAALLLVAMSMGGQAMAESGKWEKVGNKDGVMVSVKEVSGSDLLAFRGVVTTDLHIGQLMTVFLDENQRSKWVDRYKSHKTLAASSTSQTYWMHFKLPVPISDRDYVLKSDAYPNPDKGEMVVKIKSVKHPKAPENDCCVRAEAKGTYYKFEALKNGKTRITVEVHTDPKGMLPDWLINLIQEDWPSKTLNGLIKASKGADVHPKFKDWHK